MVAFELRVLMMLWKRAIAVWFSVFGFVWIPVCCWNVDWLLSFICFSVPFHAYLLFEKPLAFAGR